MTIATILMCVYTILIVVVPIMVYVKQIDNSCIDILESASIQTVGILIFFIGWIALLQLKYNFNIIKCIEIMFR